MKKFSLIGLAAFGAVTALSISVGTSTPLFGEEWKCTYANGCIQRCAERWSRFFEQNFRVDKWNLCRD
jgi:hypothetical protein